MCAAGMCACVCLCVRVRVCKYYDSFYSYTLLGRLSPLLGDTAHKAHTLCGSLSRSLSRSHVCTNTNAARALSCSLAFWTCVFLRRRAQRRASTIASLLCSTLASDNCDKQGHHITHTNTHMRAHTHTHENGVIVWLYIRQELW